MARNSRFLTVVCISLVVSLLDGRFADPVDCQGRLQTDGPCTEAMAAQVKGKWIKVGDSITTSGPIEEAKKRMNLMHEMMLGIYPSPTGVDATWSYTAGPGSFPGSSLGYRYVSRFFGYLCSPYNKTQLIGGYPGAYVTEVMVTANETFPWVTIADEAWVIDGRPVLRRYPLRQMWKGHQMFHPEVGVDRFYMLIHRKGILPYIPVTRKQYLNHSIQHFTETFDSGIKTFREMPIRSLEAQEAEKKQALERYEKAFAKDPKRLKAATDSYLSGYQTDEQRRAEQVSKAIEHKNSLLKRYQDELAKTTRDGLLDSPAIILLMHPPDLTTPIFVTEAENGSMLITLNSAYVKNDLPKHVPQVLVLQWTWDDTKEATRNIAKLVEENFPIEKLEAMIDR